MPSPGGTPSPGAAPSPGGTARVLLACDLDGTLLRSDASLSPFTVETVNAFVAAGGLFTYATARGYRTSSQLTAALDLRCPVVTYGGAAIVDPLAARAGGDPMSAAGGAVLSRALLPEPEVRAVIAATGDSATLQPIVLGLHAGTERVCWIADRRTPGVDKYLSARVGDPRQLALDSWAQIDLSAVFQVSLIGERAPLAALRAALAPRLSCHHVLSEDSYRPGVWALELVSAEGTKAAALSALQRRLGADRLVCFGDNYNDLPMFAIADHAVAVANAVPEVRAAADEIVASNDEDGVARWIAAHIGAQTRA